MKKASRKRTVAKSQLPPGTRREMTPQGRKWIVGVGKKAKMFDTMAEVLAAYRPKEEAKKMAASAGGSLPWLALLEAKKKRKEENAQ